MTKVIWQGELLNPKTGQKIAEVVMYDNGHRVAFGPWKWSNDLARFEYPDGTDPQAIFDDILLIIEPDLDGWEKR